MLQNLYLVKQFVIAFVIGLGNFFFLLLILVRLLLFDLFRNGLNLLGVIVLLLHTIRLKNSKLLIVIFVFLCTPSRIILFHHNIPLVVDKCLLFIVDVIG